MLAIGEKVFVTIRRNFETDLRHQFVGEVMDESDIAIRVTGYDFAFNDEHKDYDRREEIITYIFPLADSGLIISLLPIETNLEEVCFASDGLFRVITDKKTFKFIVSEFGFHR